MKYIKRTAIMVLALSLIFAIAFLVYVNDFYKASHSLADMTGAFEGRLETQDNLTIVHPKTPSDIGMVFYPGGKVEAQAYLPLLLQLANENITCILVEMPFNLAVFNVDGALEAKAALPDIQTWYLGGHSLGGAMASQLMEKEYEGFEGLILMGAYPVNDAPIETLAIYGTYDIMLDLEKVADADILYEIQGGNHAYFGDYGEQDGDGKAVISRQAQQAEAVEEILKFIRK